MGAAAARPTIPIPSCPTRKMQRIDSGLLAVARGDERPFGGLVPLRDDDRVDWRLVAPRLSDDLDAVVNMPLGALESLLLVHLDGKTSFDELVRLSCSLEPDVLSALDELEWLGVIEPNA